MTAESASRPQRLNRLDCIFPHTPTYFVTTCTDKRRSLLANIVVHDTLRRFAETGADRGAWVGAYILMPDHLHLFVAFDDRKMLLERWMKSLKNTISKTLRRQGVPAARWQKTFFDHVLRSEESYEEKWHYVRENPVRAGLVQNWSEWPYAGEIFPLEYRRLEQITTYDQAQSASLLAACERGG
jgi:putative transposase